jgi:hypothetical protein
VYQPEGKVERVSRHTLRLLENEQNLCNVRMLQRFFHMIKSPTLVPQYNQPSFKTPGGRSGTTAAAGSVEVEEAVGAVASAMVGQEPKRTRDTKQASDGLEQGNRSRRIEVMQMGSG